MARTWGAVISPDGSLFGRREKTIFVCVVLLLTAGLVVFLLSGDNFRKALGREDGALMAPLLSQDLGTDLGDPSAPPAVPASASEAGGGSTGEAPGPKPQPPQPAPPDEPPLSDLVPELPPLPDLPPPLELPVAAREHRPQST